MLVRESPLQLLIVPSSAEIIYYSAADPNDCTTTQKDQIYLCDCGGLSVLAFSRPCSSGNFREVPGLDSTTDVTRTLHFGTPTDGQCRACSRAILLSTRPYPQMGHSFLGYVISTRVRVPNCVQQHSIKIGYDAIKRCAPLPRPCLEFSQKGEAPSYYSHGNYGLSTRKRVPTRST
ncbi:hypothetical protein EI94DRAFT_766778 [Lactarius quietus]|nr:hypothetical protein EI94DRAFT_766778 [Lactarius quietus]